MNRNLVAKEILAIAKLLTAAHPEYSPEQLRAIAEIARGYKQGVSDWFHDDDIALGTLEYDAEPPSRGSWDSPPDEGILELTDYDKEADIFVEWNEFDYRRNKTNVGMDIAELYQAALNKIGRGKQKVTTLFGFTSPKVWLKGYANVTIADMDDKGVSFHLSDIEIDEADVAEHSEAFDSSPPEREFDLEEYRERHGRKD